MRDRRQYPQSCGEAHVVVALRIGLADGPSTSCGVGGDLCCWSAVVEPYQITATGAARVQVAAGG